MNMLSYCRAMAAFCRQRARFDGEYEAFWTEEAEEWNKLVSSYAGTLEPVGTIWPAFRDYSRADGTGPGWSADVRPEASSTAGSECLPIPVRSIRYRCPKTASQREVCQACELRVEYS
jgi:hypothetical protein